MKNFNPMYSDKGLLMTIIFNLLFWGIHAQNWQEGSISTNMDHATFVYAKDLNGDGRPDVLGSAFSGDKISWFENLGGGGFGPEQVISANANGAQCVYADDLNQDGRPDVVSASVFDNKVAWYENLGGGSFGPEQIVSTNVDGPINVYTADMDNDGYIDILSTSFSGQEIVWHRNLGGGIFAPDQIITTEAENANWVHAEDLDGDGLLDILSTSKGDHKVAWYKNEGGGSFGPQQLISSVLFNPNSVRTADLDCDNIPDVLVTQRGTGNKIVWYKNLSNGNFGPEQLISAETVFPTSAYASDFDGDGILDVVSSSVGNAIIAWYKNLGNGSFGPIQIISDNASGASAVYPIDLNGDNRPDVLSSSNFDDKIAWYENTLDLESPTECGGSGIPCLQISNSCEDAEEDDDGDVDLTSSDLDLGKYLSGLTFTNPGIPLNAYITSATITFTASESSSATTTQLVISGDTESADVCFSDNQNDLSGRQKTTETRPWAISETWNTNQTYTSPDISNIVQEIIEGSGYNPNDPISILLEEACNNHGKRSAWSFDGNAANAPILCVEYYEDVYTLSGRIYTFCEGAEDQPVPGVTVEMLGGIDNGYLYTMTDENGYYEFKVRANRNVSIEPCKVEISTCGIDNNDVNIINNHVLNPGTTQLDSPYKLLAADVNYSQAVEFADANHITDFLNGPPGIENFYEIGGQHWRFIVDTYVFPDPTNPWGFSIDDARHYNGFPFQDVPDQDFIAVKMGDVDCSYDPQCELENAESVCIPLTADCQDAEEYGGGTVALTSNLDLGKWLIGLNFINAGIPADAIIQQAQINFIGTGDEDQNDEPCSLKIWGSTDDISCFTDDDYNISSRSRTVETQNWSFTEEWNQNQMYNSPDLSDIIQEIISTPGYGTSSPINIIITADERNAGIREAYSYDENSGSAPLLCIRYSIQTCDIPEVGPGQERAETTDSGVVSSSNKISNVKAFPNPFSDKLAIDFHLGKESAVTLKIYNILGQLVYTTIQEYSAGQHQLNIENLSLPNSSLLNYMLESNGQQVSGKIMYVKN